MKNKLQDLQNAANDFGIEIKIKFDDEVRKTVKRYLPTRYFATMDGVNISPVLVYEEMKCFLLGFRISNEIYK